jgi:response regulator RpfG family c-di-GMP phosphodiesterase
MVVAIIDVSETNQKAYAHILSRIGNVKVKPFTSPDAALVWCGKQEHDLVILDYRMGQTEGMDGLEFVRAYNKAHGDTQTPLVMITGEKDREIRHRALELGASDFLNKPADPVEFLSRVKNLLALRESRKKLENYAASLAQDVARATQEIADREEETINRLTRAAEFRDSETGLHIVRMGKYAEVLGRTLELDSEDQRLLRLATPMHDIGKVATPDGILLKEGPLNPDEWEIMKRHARAGYDILVGSSSKVLQLASQIALRHHERWDGTGYPDHLRGTQIPLAARIAAVGDVFDALISKRPYKRAWSNEEALRVIQKSSGSHFDPIVVDALNASWSQFLDIQKEYADTDHAA